MTLYCSQGHVNASDSRFCRLCGEVLPIGGGAIAGQLLALRYRIVSELGQGGFGRTYLAEDTNRFDEACVLKEFAPQVDEPTELQKAEELFAREAGILYQLQHPQIPRFRELFRAEWQDRERIFLVQDYVAGQTYEDLLQQRLQRGDRFSESDGVELLLQLLPVLDYIHAAGVIHRDISPDNLIQRSADALPVLIDFGGVKQVAARVVSKPVTPDGTATRLGKVGYAPAEQLELGEVYPHSDLHALAVTILVLLTGQEPGALFHRQGALDRNHWRQLVHLRPALVTILARMLEPYPTKRYQTAADVLQALEAAGYRSRYSGPSAPPQAGAPIPVFAPDPATIAIAPKRLTPAAPVVPKARQPGRNRMTRAIAKIVLLLGLITGGWWAGVKWIGPALKSQLPEITNSAKPQPSPQSTPSQSPNFPPTEQERKQQIEAQRQQLGIDNTFLVNLVNEAFYAKHPELNGQKLGIGEADADLRQEWDELALAYLKRLEFLSSDTRSRLGQFTEADVLDRQTAASEINLSGRALNDLTDAAFFHRFPEHPRGENLLDRSIGQVWQAVAADQLKLLQAGQTLERVQFPPGNFSDRLTGTLKPGAGKAYIANLSANQTLQLRLQSGQPVLLSLYPPTSDQPALLSDSAETSWSGKLLSSGYYEITVVADGKETNYTIDLAVADDVSSPE